MIVLGIETATEMVGVAVGDETGQRAGVWATGRRRHTESLAPAIEQAMALAGYALGDLEAVAVDVGPGLFTGLRVGVATAKGLAQGLGIGVRPATSLEVLARAAHDAGHRGPVLAVVDARRAEVFAALYRPGDGTGAAMVEVAPPAVCAPDELGDLAGPPTGLLAVGDGALRYAESIGRTLPGVVVAGPSLAAPPPAALLRLVGERADAGTAPLAAGAVTPVYLRDADARINWSRRRPVVAGG